MLEAVTKPGSILVVDDNPLIVSVVRSLLAKESHDVVTASNGAEALQALENRSFDVIICDVMMPKMDGYEFHQHVRQKSELSHIPFVFLTALGEVSEVNHGKATGADDYLVKPFEPEQLLSVVQGKILRSKSLVGMSEAKYDAYRKKVIHTLSHEFRTPLVAINTGTELLLEEQELDQKKAKQLLEAIQRSGRRLEQLVTDFMILQQIEAGVAARVFETRRSFRSLRDIVKQFVACYEGAVHGEGYRLVIEDHAPHAVVLAYDPQIHDVLWRLVSNAMKFQQGHDEVEIVTLARDGKAIAEVRDRGLGLDPERIREAIDLFGQLDRDKFEQQGGGIGLAIASKYAAIHGGRLEFERRPGGGSVVSLLLPLTTRP